MSDPSLIASLDAEPPSEADVTAITVRKMAWMIVTAVVPLAVYFVIPLDDRFARVFALLLVLTAAVALIPLSFHQARLVIRSTHPLFEAVRCIVTAVVFLVVSFSTAYFVLATSYEGQMQGMRTKLDSLYFTVTVLATVGFGDITATGQFARAVVTCQMMVNLAVLAVALRVVSWALRERQGDALARRVNQPKRSARAKPPATPS